MRWKQWRPTVTLPVAVLLLGTVATVTTSAQAAPQANPTPWGLCSTNAHAAGCSDVSNAYPSVGWHGKYVGHDEPSLLFYSDRRGSGNNNTYLLKLPKDPVIPPNQAGTGGTANFELHPAFWFGMALCDSQSFPNYTTKCAADTDRNIANSANPASRQYIGKHPGTAFMEMQFYPPGWAPWPAGNSCDPTQWCAALNIDSYSSNANNVNNNSACLNSNVGLEYVNFAFITKDGKAQAPSNPLDATLATYTPDKAKDLFMNSGDVVSVHMYDTEQGFKVVINDFSTHQSGSMTASISNQFAQINYRPTATTCTATPYAFHPMYATSSPSTRVPWAAHSYNVAFADEIGHFEYCGAVNASTGSCSAGGATDATVDNDDIGCFTPAQSSFYPITGCLAADNDFDGPEYSNHWPGTAPASVTAQPIVFTSPVFNGDRRFRQVAFEADLPRIEYQNLGRPTGPWCDPATGANCVNPPPGASFYPFFTTSKHHDFCVWQLGGAGIPGTTRTFGGSSVTEYGTSPLALLYAGPNNTPYYKYEDFRTIQGYNPC